jgi:hypothetical protein
MLAFEIKSVSYAQAASRILDRAIFRFVLSNACTIILRANVALGDYRHWHTNKFE